MSVEGTKVPGGHIKHGKVGWVRGGEQGHHEGHTGKPPGGKIKKAAFHGKGKGR